MRQLPEPKVCSVAESVDPDVPSDSHEQPENFTDEGEPPAPSPGPRTSCHDTQHANIWSRLPLIIHQFRSNNMRLSFAEVRAFHKYIAAHNFTTHGVSQAKHFIPNPVSTSDIHSLPTFAALASIIPTTRASSVFPRQTYQFHNISNFGPMDAATTDDVYFIPEGVRDWH